MRKQFTRKQFSKEFKSRAVRLVYEHANDYDSATEAMTAIAKQLDCSTESLHRWSEQDQVYAVSSRACPVPSGRRSAG